MVFFYLSGSPKIKKKKGENENKNKNYQKLDLDINFKLESLSVEKNFLSGTFNKIFSNKFVMINFDCEKFKAKDIYMILKDFIPVGGHILKVFILKKLTPHEEKIIQTKKIFYSSSFNKGEKDIWKKKSKENTAYSSEKKKKKNIFAYIICDSLRTVSFIYKNCNGLEFGFTNNVVDMRPVSKVSIKNFRIIDRMNEIPKSYFPNFLEISENKQFYSQSLCFFSQKPFLKSPKEFSNPSLKVFKENLQKKGCNIQNLFKSFSPKKEPNTLKYDFQIEDFKNQPKFSWKFQSIEEKTLSEEDVKFFKNIHFFKSEPKFF